MIDWIISSQGRIKWDYYNRAPISEIILLLTGLAVFKYGGDVSNWWESHVF
jgi:hypothetical protein